MKIRQFRGKFVGRSKANWMNDFLLTLPKPDRTALEKESNEFIELIKERRAQKSHD